MNSADDVGRPDGRRARRDRNRNAVIDAVFELLSEGSPLTTELVAARAGVSISSLFRYFESLDDLQRQSIERHFERFGALFEIPEIGVGPPDDRIARFVDARLQLHRSVAPVARLARSRSLDHPRIATTLATTRQTFAQQVRDHFRPELGTRTAAGADDLVGSIDTLTSFESWDLLHTTHRRSGHQIRRAWIDSVAALLADR